MKFTLDMTVRLGDRVLVKYPKPFDPRQHTVDRRKIPPDPAGVIEWERGRQERYEQELELHEILDGKLWLVVRIYSDGVDVAASADPDEPRFRVLPEWIAAREMEEAW